MNDIVMPGDELATNEEYMPGPGTFEKGGIIYSSVIGRRDFNETEKIARVSPLRTLDELREGDIVICEIIHVSNSLARVIVHAQESFPKPQFMNLNGVIHVSRIRDDYDNDVRNHFRIGDLVRARVDQVSPSLQLSTKDEELGVLKARCQRCRSFLQNRDGTLHCKECQRDESRKVAGDYHHYTPYYAD